MRQGGGKAKGAAFEREICKKLSLWISGGEKEDLLWRSAMSGGRATVQHRRGVIIRQAGDICSVSEEGHEFTNKWFVECKHVKKLALDQFLIKSSGPLQKFWMKAMREADRHRRDPMIIAKQNGWPILVITLAGHVARWYPPEITSGRIVDVTMFDKMISRAY